MGFGEINIQLYDNEDSDYPIIQLKESGYDDFKKDLEKYRDSNEEMYNIDDFIAIIKEKDYFIDSVYWDERVFFWGEKMKEKEFQEKIEEAIIIPIYFGFDDKENVIIDTDSIEDEFRSKLDEIERKVKEWKK